MKKNMTYQQIWAYALSVNPTRMETNRGRTFESPPNAWDGREGGRGSLF